MYMRQAPSIPLSSLALAPPQSTNRLDVRTSPVVAGAMTSTTVTASPVTPLPVAPPFAPLNDAAHGGESGSSVWRGGVPTHRFCAARRFSPDSGTGAMACLLPSVRHPDSAPAPEAAA